MKGGKCKNCAHYKAYYIKLYCTLCSEKSGLCGKNENAVGERDCCGKFNPRKEITKEIINELENTIEDINEMKRFF